MTAKPAPEFIPSLDYHAWNIRASRGFDATLAEFVAHAYFWWIAHALATKDAIAVPSLVGNSTPNLTGFAVVEQPGIYRVELLGPAAIPDKPRTGIPISTIYSIHAPYGPSPSVVKEWNQILHDYGSKYRCELPARSFITVIKHKYVKLDAALTQAVARSATALVTRPGCIAPGKCPPAPCTRGTWRNCPRMTFPDETSSRALQRVRSSLRQRRTRGTSIPFVDASAPRRGRTL